MYYEIHQIVLIHQYLHPMKGILRNINSQKRICAHVFVLIQFARNVINKCLLFEFRNELSKQK